MKMVKANSVSACLAAVFSFAVAANTTPQQQLKTLELPPQDCVIVPSEVVDVGTPVPGVVDTIRARRTDMIQAGSVLATLDANVEKASVELAKTRSGNTATIELRQKNAEFGQLTQKRYNKLLRSNSISQQDMDQLANETEVAQLQVKQEQEQRRVALLEYVRAQAQLEQRTIRSPVNGVVMDRYKSVGEYVDDQPLFRIAQLDPLYVEVIVPVQYFGQITTGMKAEVQSVLPGTPSYQAEVDRVDIVADAASGTFGVRLILPNSDYQIPAGLRCQATFAPVNLPLENDSEHDFEQARFALSRSQSELAKQPLQACFQMGPFQDTKQARELASRLEGTASRIGISKQLVSQDMRYFVLALPESESTTVAEMKLQLRAAGFDNSYTLTSGPNKGKVSLGYFKDEKRAIALRESVLKRGVRSQVVPVTQASHEYWLKLVMNDSDQLASQVSEISQLMAPALEFEQQQCPANTSEENALQAKVQ